MPITALLALATHRTLHGAAAALWPYVALGASVSLLEETAPVLAGFTARQEHLPVVRAAIACAIGGWVTTLVPYAIGRYGATPLLRRWPAAAAALTRLTGVAAQRPWRAAVASRFVFGARTLLPLACGAANVRVLPFLIASALSAAVWSAGYMALGWMSGETVLLILGRARRHHTAIAVAFAIVILAAVLLMQRRNRPHVAEELMRTDEFFGGGD